MLEILLIIFLARKIGAMVEAKGHGKILYQVVFVAFWFGGEVFGAIAGVILASSGGKEPGFAIPYICALIGALVGAVAAFILAACIPEVQRERGYMDEYERFRDGGWEPDPRSKKRRDDRVRRRSEDEYEDRPRRRRPEEEDEPRPRRRVRPAEDEEDDRPRRRRDYDEGVQDRPRRPVDRRRREEYEE
jgi:hypothetical protein